VHPAVDTLGSLLVVLVTAANGLGRIQAHSVAAQIQEAAGESVEIVFAGQGYRGVQRVTGV
jgi:hypothetical protein